MNHLTEFEDDEFEENAATKTITFLWCIFVWIILFVEIMKHLKPEISLFL